MSYTKRTPCQKYYDKSNKDGLHKSLSATRFVPFRRSSDTTSDSGSDDFKIEAAEELSSSFSRSSSESCHSYGVNSRYHCILKDLNEINSLGKELNLEQNESVRDFQSRLNMRRKIKTREVFSYQDDDRTDNSCDSTTTKAHEEILRSANLLKQEQVERKDDFTGKKTFHKEVQCSFNKRFAKPEIELCSRNKEEAILMNEFDKILQIRNEDEEEPKMIYQSGPTSSSTITRSSTETFLTKSNSSKTHKSVNSPRIRPKTHSQVLKAATSIPSLIFSNKSLKFQKSSNNFNYNEQSGDKLVNSKKNSIDDDFFSIGSNKTRRSPLRFLGNLVDDKIFRGRWGSTKRAKSTDEITWALANEDSIQNDVHLLKESNRNRKKSLGLTSTNSTSSNNTEDNQDKKRYKGSDKAKNMGDLICKKLFDEGYNTKKESSNERQKMVEVKKRKSSNTSSDMLSISGSSVASLNDHGHFVSNAFPIRHNQPDVDNEIRAETLAEIEAFEELLKNHLQS